MRKINVFLRSSDAKCLRFGLRCGLACDASARDAKSLAMRVERCEPLRNCRYCRTDFFPWWICSVFFCCMGVFCWDQRPQAENEGWDGWGCRIIAPHFCTTIRTRTITNENLEILFCLPNGFSQTSCKKAVSAHLVLLLGSFTWKIAYKTPEWPFCLAERLHKCSPRSLWWWKLKFLRMRCHLHKNDYKWKSGDLFCFRFHKGKANNFPEIFFRVCLRNHHVGHAQATTAGHTYEISLHPGGYLSLWLWQSNSLVIVSVRMVMVSPCAPTKLVGEIFQHLCREILLEVCKYFLEGGNHCYPIWLRRVALHHFAFRLLSLFPVNLFLTLMSEDFCLSLDFPSDRSTFSTFPRNPH